MNILNLVYANMVKEAQEELNKIWIPNVGDFAIAENGVVGVLTNNKQQEVMIGDDISEAYIGVSLVHNGQLWSSLNPIWMPKLGQLVEFIPGIDTPQEFLSRFNRWLFSNDATYTCSKLFTAVEELAFCYYMEIVHNKRWIFDKKVWVLQT